MVSQDARERVLNTLVRSLNDSGEIENALRSDDTEHDLTLSLSGKYVGSGEERIKDLVENIKSDYLYNKTKYIVRVDNISTENNIHVEVSVTEK